MAKLLEPKSPNSSAFKATKIMSLSGVGSELKKDASSNKKEIPDALSNAPL